LKALYRSFSISKVALKVLLATDDEVELLPGHGGVDDEGHCHLHNHCAWLLYMVPIIFFFFFL
jgi:hypothetical protein